MRYDAIIADSSFVGLTVASELDGDIMSIDQKEFGTSLYGLRFICEWHGKFFRL